MTKKDYDLIAACIGGSLASIANEHPTDSGRSVGINDLTDRLVLELELDNPRFDKTIFWKRIVYWRNQHEGK